MLDKSTAKLLAVLSKICTDGSYKIIEIGELIKAMLPRYKIDAAALGQAVRYLADNEMIDVKYSDEKVYCVAILPKGRVKGEETRIEKKYGTSFGRRIVAALVCACFLASSLGAVVGVLVSKLFFG